MGRLNFAPTRTVITDQFDKGKGNFTHLIKTKVHVRPFKGSRKHLIPFIVKQPGTTRMSKPITWGLSNNDITTINQSHHDRKKKKSHQDYQQISSQLLTSASLINQWHHNFQEITSATFNQSHHESGTSNQWFQPYRIKSASIIH